MLASDLIMVTKQKKPIAYIVAIGAGLESFVYREVDAITNMGQEIILFATKYVKGDVYSPKDKWQCFYLSLFSLIFQLPWLLLQSLLKPALLVEAIKTNSLIDLIFALKYSPIMKKQGVKQIHCHFGDHKLFIGYYCKKLTGLPLSVTIHSHELHVNPNEEMFKIAIKECDRVFAISQLAVNILLDRYGVDSQRVILSKLPLDLDVWNNRKPVRVVTVGRFQPQKGFNYLFEAAQLVSDNIEFIVIGFGPLDVVSMAEELGVSHKITFFEKLNQAQLKFIYQSCDIYCLPSISHPEQGKEGIPVVLMEAMSCGMAVVATDAGAVNELVENVLVEEKSAEQLATAIQKLADNEALRRQQAERNMQIIRERHSLKNLKLFSDKLFELSE
ncbi:MAG TPA: glycosyltransferase family 4 protein [Gammaproteobacteria bacterium]